MIHPFPLWIVKEVKALIHTYEEAVEWIHSRMRFGIKPGLRRMEWMMEKLSHPERRLKVIHVGGTNGKGSTVTYLRSILQSAGFQAGTFTSPYFERFNERIGVNGVPVTDEDLVKLANMIKPLAEELEETALGAPTEFEVITAMAFVYFAKIKPVDVLLLEVGLGGKYDSTNIIFPVLSLITSIGIDHTNILGSSLFEIAKEKAGIIKSGVPLITGVSEEEVLAILTEKARNVRATPYVLGKDMNMRRHESLVDGEQFTIQTPFRFYKNLQIRLMGKHQTENAALAVMAADWLTQYLAFDISEAAIRTGLKQAHWPGRFEVISKSPLVIIDGAHNEAGVAGLVATVKERYPEKRKHLVFTALKDKDLTKMIAQLDALADELTFVQFDFPRASTAEQLYEQSNAKQKRCIPDWRQAVQEKLSQLTDDDLLLITGSLYFLAEVRPVLLKQLGQE